MVCLDPLEPADQQPRPLEQVEREICELAAHLAAATCRWLLLIAEFDERLGWAEWGVKSCAHWLSWRCSIGLGTAREHVRVARRMAELPLVSGAFATGELSYSKVRALTRVAVPETEASLVELARHATGAQVEKLIRGYEGALRACTESADRSHERRCLQWQIEDDGSLSIRGRLPAEDGALLLRALESADDPAATGLDAGARHADALTAVARAALETKGRERSGGDPVEVIVHVDAASLAAERVVERCEIEGGPVVAPETARRLSCDAAVVCVAEGNGQTLDVGRRTRSIPPALRRALRSRDGGCRFPGCTHRRFLHAHHITHWARGGETKLGNLVQLCSHHHRLVHEGGFGVEVDHTGRLRFRRRNGDLIAAVPPGLRARGHDLCEQQREAGLSVDAWTCMPRSAGQPLDYGIAVEALLARATGPPSATLRW